MNIDPVWIFHFDQFEFPNPLPGFDLSFSFERFVAGSMLFKPDQNGHIIFGREAFESFLAVLFHAGGQVICVASI